MQDIFTAIQGLTRTTPVAAALADGYQYVTAQRLTAQHYPQVDLSLPLLLAGVESPTQAAQLKQILLNAYPAHHPVTILQADALAKTNDRSFPLHEFDQIATQSRSVLYYLPPLQPAGFTALQEIVAHLRAPEGCPWDRAQTLLTMRHDLLSECAEVIEAIDAEMNGKDNSPHIAEEVGDLLMAAVLMIQIATEEKRFQMADVINGVVTKLIRRHPHVFDNLKVDGVQTVLANWDAIKAQEKVAKGQTNNEPLAGVPAGLPALEKARQLQSKAAKAGLLDREALAQMRPELLALLSTTPTEARLGEILWQIVAVAHKADLNAEDALRSYTVHFRQTTAEDRGQ